MSQPTKPDFSVVGRSLPRVDAAAKAKGETLYTDDMQLPGMVYGRIKRSTIGHGYIRKIDCSRALALPGVLAVITGHDAPRPYCIVPHQPTERALALDKVRYCGEPIAALAAVDEETADEALDLIDVTYEELPVLLDPLEAMARDDVRIHDIAPYNVHFEGKQNFGDVDAAFAAAHLTVENTFRTLISNHAFMEPQASLADYNANTGKLTLHTATQLPHHLHRILTDVLDMPMESIRVVVPAVGGGFGGKTEASATELCAALLSRRIGRPVKVTLDRPEVFAQGKGRHPCIMKMRMGFEKDGRLTALDFDNILDGGAHSSWGVIVLFFTAALTHLPYRIPNVRFNGRRVYTNRPSSGAQRGLGGVQVRMAVESLLDEAAHRLGMSPYDLRMLNAIDNGYITASGVQVPHTEYKQCLESVVSRSGYLEKHGKLPFGRGVGLAGGHYTSGASYMLYQTYKPQSTAIVRADTEAGITLFTGATDIGQGSTTVLAQMVAEELGVSLDEVSVVCQDTLLAPFDNGTFDSRVTYGAGHAVRNAARELTRQLAEVVAPVLGVPKEHLQCRDGFMLSIYEPKKRMAVKAALTRFIDAHGPLVGVGHFSPPRPKNPGKYPGAMSGPSPTFGFTAQVAEVDVNLETGKVKVLRYTEAGDCGQAINPMSVEGQVQGAILMGIGEALFEQVHVGPDGKLLNPNLHDYKIPTAMDMPIIDSHIVDSYDPGAPFGAKETGEGPINPVIPAILNALYDAIGVRFTEVPVTPEKVLRALGKLRG